MKLSFLNLLSKEQLLSLINYAIFRNEQHIDKHFIARQLYIRNEEDRCDVNGDQEMYVSARNNEYYHTGDVVIQDFKMEDVVTKKDYSSSLREYMFKVFGQEYLDELKKYYELLGIRECERLMSPTKTK